MEQQEIRKTWEEIGKNLVTSQVETITSIRMLEENMEKLDKEINKWKI